MNTEISKAFDLAGERLAKLNKIDLTLGVLAAEQEVLRVKEQELRASLLKENADVEKIETKNITTVFYSVVGSLDEHVDKERAEAFAAKQKYDQVLKDMDDVKTSISAANIERAEYANFQQEYERLFVQKRDEIMQMNDETAQKILALTESLDREKSNLKKINEALDTGKLVFEMINTILASLNKAIGLGVVNTVYTDFLTYSHVQEDMKEIDNNQTLLLRLKAKLEDVHINSDFIINKDGVVTFAFEELYNPRLLADWGATSRITESKKAQECVLRVKTRLWDILEALKNRLAKAAADSESLEAEIDELVIKA